MTGKNHSLTIRIALLWLAILLMGSFWLTTRVSLDPVSLVVLPTVPRAGEPIVVTVKLNNPSGEALSFNYELYVNGEMMKEGITSLPPRTAKVYQYAYENRLKPGEQVNFMVRTISRLGRHEKIMSLPSYPPQVLSSFVSFASFSTSLMSSMSSMTYYQTTFGKHLDFNLGVLFTVVLVTLLVFLEMSQPILRARTINVLGRLQIKFSVVTWILFIIFMGIFYTSIIMIISAV